MPAHAAHSSEIENVFPCSVQDRWGFPRSRTKRPLSAGVHLWTKRLRIVVAVGGP